MKYTAFNAERVFFIHKSYFSWESSAFKRTSKSVHKNKYNYCNVPKFGSKNNTRIERVISDRAQNIFKGYF